MNKRLLMIWMAVATAGCAQINVGTPAEIEPLMNVALSAAEYRWNYQRWPQSLEELCLSTVIIQSVWAETPETERETPAAQRCRQAPYSEIDGLRLEHADEALVLRFSPVRFQGKAVSSARVRTSSAGDCKVEFGG